MGNPVAVLLAVVLLVLATVSLAAAPARPGTPTGRDSGGPGQVVLSAKELYGGFDARKVLLDDAGEIFAGGNA